MSCIVTPKTALEVRLSQMEAVDAGGALRLQAGEAYDDDRLHEAYRQYLLAAKLLYLAGFAAPAARCTYLAHKIAEEQIARAAGDEDAADECEAEIRKELHLPNLKEGA